MKSFKDFLNKDEQGAAPSPKTPETAPQPAVPEEKSDNVAEETTKGVRMLVVFLMSRYNLKTNEGAIEAFFNIKYDEVKGVAREFISKLKLPVEGSNELNSIVEKSQTFPELMINLAVRAM